MKTTDYSKTDINIVENNAFKKSNIKMTIGKQIEQCEILLDYSIEMQLNKSTILFLSLFRTELIFKYKTGKFKMVHGLSGLYKEMIKSNPIMEKDFEEEKFNKILDTIFDDAIGGYDIRDKYSDLKYNLAKDCRVIFVDDAADSAFIDSIKKLNNCIVF